MSASRENFNLFNKYGYRNIRYYIFRKKIPWSLMFEDTLMPLVCKVRGHIKYDAGEGDYACRRCHKYIGHYNYNPPEEIGLINKKTDDEVLSQLAGK
jgi:hypothetical protein